MERSEPSLVRAMMVGFAALTATLRTAIPMHTFVKRKFKATESAMAAMAAILVAQVVLADSDLFFREFWLPGF